MMDDENNVLFVRGSVQNTTCTSVDDVWDDTALIKAYDKAVNLAKDEVVRRMGMEIESTQEKSAKSENYKKTHQRQKPCRMLRHYRPNSSSSRALKCIYDNDSDLSPVSTRYCYRKWTVGSPCKAIYSTDGEIYEAIVTKVYENTGNCIVKFVGYGNSEKVESSSLLESDGLESQIAQQKSATAINDSQTNVEESYNSSPLDTAQSNGSTGERMDYESEKPKLPKNVFNPGVSFNSTYGMMPPAPPIPPQLMAKLPDNDADALSSMLMSWYISGFHTGYYHGIKQARNLEDRRKK